MTFGPTIRAKIFSESSRSTPIGCCLVLLCVGLLGLKASERITVKGYACDNKPCTKRSVISLPKRDSLHRVEVFLPVRRENRRLALMLFRDGEPETSEPLARQLDGVTDWPVHEWPFRNLGPGEYEAVAQLLTKDGESFVGRARFFVVSEQ